jgi:RHS repeat-associated protein
MGALRSSLIALVLAGVAGCAAPPDIKGMVRDLGGKLGAAITGSGASGFPEPAGPPAGDCDWQAALQPPDWPATVRACTDAVRTQPKVARFHFHHGRALEATGKPAEAVRAYREALALLPDYPGAQTALGELTERGLGVPADPARAARWYRKAAYAGFASAQAHLGRLYRDGVGEARDPQEAARWFELAAAQGHPAAQRALGRTPPPAAGAVDAPPPAPAGRRDPPAPGSFWPALAGLPRGAALVDRRTGSLALSVVDLELPAGAVSLEVRRVFQAGPRVPGLLGTRWQIEWDRRLVREGPLLLLLTETGPLTLSPRGSSAEYGTLAGDRVAVDASGGAVLSRLDGTSERYDASGRLVERDYRNGNRVRFHHDAEGRLVRVEGPRGRSLHLLLDERGRAIRIAAPGGPAVDYGYRGDDLVQVSFGHGAVVRYAYATDGALARMLDPRTGLTELAYDARGRVTGLRAADGTEERYEYDDGGRAVRHIDPTGAVTTTRWSTDRRREEVTDPLGQVTVSERDEAGRLVRLVRPTGASRRMAYDTVGRAVEVEEGGQVTRIEYLGSTSYPRVVSLADGAHLTYDYDAQSNLRVVRHEAELLLALTYTPDGLIATAKRQGETERRLLYDAEGRLVGSVDALGRSVRVDLDASARPVRLVDLLGNATTLAYDPKAQVVTVTEPGGAITRVEYAPSGLPVKVTYPTGATRSYAYDARGRLIRLADAPGGTTQYEYDAAGRLASTKDAAGQPWRYEYDRAGRLVREIDARGGVTARAYDALGQLTAVSDPTGMTTRFEYTAAGLLQRIVDPRGGVTVFAYDAMGRLVAETDAMGRTTRYGRDARGRVQAVTGPDGATTRLEYDAEGRVVAVVDALGGRTTRTYDAAGRLATITEADDRTTRYEYDDRGLLARVVDPAGRALLYAYDGRGRLAALTDPAGRVTRYETDAVGRVQKILHPGGRASTVRRDAAGRETAVASAGYETRMDHDVLGRLARVTQPGGFDIAYRYDPLGNLAGWKDAVGGASLEYDPAGRLAAVTGAGAKAPTRYRYDPAGAPVEVTDPLGQSTRFAYTLADELTEVETASGDRARYEYDAAGRLAAVRHPGGGVTRFAHDPLGRLISSTDPLGRSARYTYDRVGRVVSTTDAKGQTTTFAYDAAGRLAEKRLADGRAVRYRYDERGDLVEVDDGRFPVRYAYDPIGQLIRVEYPTIRRSLAWAYTLEGRLAKQTDSEGGVTTRAYDPAGRLARITAPGGQAIGFEYDARGRLTALAYPNGVRGRIEYDAADRQTRIAYSGGKGPAVGTWRFAYDAAGNRVEAVDATGKAVHYRYDTQGQLTEEGAGGAPTARYRYLAGGNRGERQRDGTTTAYRYDEADRLLEAGGESFAYDANGNLVERRGPGGVRRYEYDAEDRLVKAVRPDGSTVAFGYAPTGERAWRRDADGLTWFVTDGLHVLAELDEGLRARATYLHGPGIDQPLAMIREGRPLFFHADAVGSVIALTDQQGAVAARYEYDAFGAVRRVAGDIESPFGFTGREGESALGLYYFRARYYDPALGRFLSPDSAPRDLRRVLALNPYLYARNDPVNLSDPLGLEPQPSTWSTRPQLINKDGKWFVVLYRGQKEFSGRILSPAAREGGLPASSEAYARQVAAGDPRTGVPGLRGAVRVHQQSPSGSAFVSTSADPRVAGESFFSGHPEPGNPGRVIELHVPVERMNRSPWAPPGPDRLGVRGARPPTPQDVIPVPPRLPAERGIRVPTEGEWVVPHEVPPEWIDKVHPGGQTPPPPSDLAGRPYDARPRFSSFQGPSLLERHAGKIGILMTSVTAINCLKHGDESACEQMQWEVGGALVGAAGAALTGAALTAGAAVGATVGGLVVTTKQTLGALRAAGQELATGVSQWQDRERMYAEAEARRQANLARAEQTLAALEARARGVEALRGPITALRTTARTQASLAQTLRGQAAALRDAVRGHEGTLKEAALLCTTARRLASEVEAYAAKAEEHANRVVQGLSWADSAGCQTAADARRISSVYQNAEGLTAGIAAESAKAQSANARLQEILGRLEAARAVPGQAQAAAAQAAAAAAAADAAFVSTGAEVERSAALAAGFDRAKRELVAAIARIAGEFPEEVQGRFQALRDRVAAIALPGDDASGAIVQAQNAAVEAKTAADQARALAQKLAAAPACAVPAVSEQTLARADGAATLAGFALSRSQHLPQKAAECAQLAEPPPEPGPGLGEALGGLLPQLIDIYNRGAGGGGTGTAPLLPQPSPVGGGRSGQPAGGGQVCSRYQAQLQRLFQEHQRIGNQFLAASRAGNRVQGRTAACQMMRSSDQILRLLGEARNAGCPAQGPIEAAAAQNRQVAQQACR